MKGWVITAIRKDGLRHMATHNNSNPSYPTKEQAQTAIDQIIEVNNSETIAQCMGSDLQPREVELYTGGDSKQTVFKD